MNALSKRVEVFFSSCSAPIYSLNLECVFCLPLCCSIFLADEKGSSHISIQDIYVWACLTSTCSCDAYTYVCVCVCQSFECEGVSVFVCVYVYVSESILLSRTVQFYFSILYTQYLCLSLPLSLSRRIHVVDAMVRVVLYECARDPCMAGVPLSLSLP